MTQITESVGKLIDEFAKLPGIGRKSAERLAYHMLRVPKAEALGLADAIRNVRENVRYCQTCYNLAEGEQCAICRDPKRERGAALHGRAAARPDGPGTGGRLSRLVSRAAGANRPAGWHRPRPAHDRPAGRARPRRRRFAKSSWPPTRRSKGTAPRCYISNLLAEFARARSPGWPAASRPAACWNTRTRKFWPTP